MFDKAVDGTGVTAGSGNWSMSFVIPDAGVTVTVKVVIDETGVGEDDAEVSGIVMQ